MSQRRSPPTNPLRKKRKEATLSLKQEIFKFRDENPKLTQRQVADYFGLDNTTVSKLLKDRTEWEEKIRTTPLPLTRKRLRYPPFFVIELALLLWFRELQCTNPSFLIHDPVLLHQAQTLADKANIEPRGTSIDIDWVLAWRKRNNIVCGSIQGESGSADTEAGERWVSDTFTQICTQFKTDEIWNADETGLYWRRLPRLALMERGKKLRGIHLSKDRVSVLLCCSMTGEKFLPFVIGPSEKPRAFSSLAYIPVIWGWNKSAWMTSYWFRDWLGKFNGYAKNMGKRFALILDNCSCHKVETAVFDHREDIILNESSVRGTCQVPLYSESNKDKACEVEDKCDF
jgi:transcriptional regulator with XRE-family HTH domain